MSDFINTRDLIGDQESIDRLSDGTLVNLKESGANVVGEYALLENTSVRLVELPNVSVIQRSAFQKCTSLEVIKLGGYGSSNSLTIDQVAFSGCSNLKHLLIDRPTMAALSYSTAFYYTPIARGEGAVYVPENLVDTYKADNLWGNYFIAKLSYYPLTVFDSIQDSWSTILTNPQYSTAYSIKDTKTMELTDGTKIKMDIAAIDADDKSDDSGKAKITWICHGIPYVHRMNATSTTSGGWADSEMRSWLASDVLTLIPQEIRSHIVSVKKTYYTVTPSIETLVSDDSIWIPSAREASLDVTTESSGVRYSAYFSQKKKYYGTTLKHWFLRSAVQDVTSYFWGVRDSGDRVWLPPTDSTYGVVFGFCTD